MSELTNTNPSSSAGGRAPNDPCASNDAETFALTQAMFARSQETGEWADAMLGVNEDAFNFELSGPCTTTTEATELVEATTEATTTSATTTSTTTTTADPTGQPTPAPTTAAPSTEAPTSAEPTTVVTGSPALLDSDGALAGTDATEAAASTGGTAVSTVVSTTVAAETTATSQAATATTEATDATSNPEEGTEYKSFYSCSGGGPSDGSNGVGTAPPNSKEVTLTYDYELHTSSPFEESILSSFENAIAHDLAGQFGLVNCGNSGGGRLRRRNLRVLRGEEVLALGSEPVDDSLAGTYDCEVEVNLGESSSCTPVRGYMTAWIPESSNVEEAEAQLLALIENGMTNDLYTSDDVLKASYVGVREDGSDKGQGGVDDGSGGNVNDGNANLSAGTGDGSTDGSNGSTNPSNGGSTNDGNANPSTGGPNVDGAQGADTDPGQEESDGPPLVAIGIALFFLAFAMAVGLFVYMRRRRRRQFFSDGPDDMGNGQSLAAQAALSDGEAPHDPDDVQLLPSPDKLDMRSVYSEETSTDCETENYTYEDYRNKEKEMTSRYGTLYGGSYGDGGAAVINTLSSTTMDYGDINDEKDGDTPKMANGMVGAGSSLAAMGVASTLAARSFSPPPVPEDAPASPDSAGYDVPPSPMEPVEDDDSEADYGVQATPGADSDDSHVGTVEAVTPGAGLADGSSVGFPDVSPGEEEKVEEGVPSMDSRKRARLVRTDPWRGRRAL